MSADRMRAPVVVAVLAGLALCAPGCAAHLASGASSRDVRLRPMVVHAGGKEAVALAGLNADELFQVGVAAFAAKDYEKAARAFSLFVAIHPKDARIEEARFDAGLAWERMGEYLRALAHDRVLVDTAKGQMWRDAAFRTAECLYHLEDYGHAAELLDRVAKADDGDPDTFIRAKVQKGICLLDGGDDDAAETALRRAVGRYILVKDDGKQSVDPYYAAQGQFYLGELYRLRYEHARFDPADDDVEELGKDLEHKAELLLSAQGHYLRAIRMGQVRWATASGYRIGRLYEVLYQQLSAARPPRSLKDPAERLAYRKLLHDRIRTLLEKAMAAYERTLATAERVGVSGAWKSRVESSFERVKQMLLSTAEPEPESEPARKTPASDQKTPDKTMPAD